MSVAGQSLLGVLQRTDRARARWQRILLSTQVRQALGMDSVERTSPLSARPGVRRWRALLAVAVSGALVAVCGLTLAAFDARVRHPAPVAVYPVDVGAATWVRSSTGGPTSWFRTTITVATRPSLAVLWLDADQTYHIWVNGHRGPSNTLDVRAGLSPVLHPLDIRAALTRGTNVIGVEVTNEDGRDAALLAHLVIRQDDGTGGEWDTLPGVWQATSDAALIGGAPALLPAFTTAGFPVAGWTPVRIGAWLRTDRSVLPQAVMERPLAGRPIGGPPGATAADVVLTTSIDLPARAQSAWLRLATLGSYDLTIGGQLVDSSSWHPQSDHLPEHPSPLYLVDVSGALAAGNNDISVHVWGHQPATLALDGTVVSGAAVLNLATGPQWTIADDGSAGGSNAVLLGSARTIWASGLAHVAVPAPTLRVDPDGIGVRTLIPAELLAGWLLVGGLMAWRRRMRPDLALRIVAAAFAPVLVLELLLGQYARFPWGATSTFPYVPSMEWVLLGLLGLALAVTWLTAPGHREPESEPQEPAPAAPQAPGARDAPTAPVAPTAQAPVEPPPAGPASSSRRWGWVWLHLATVRGWNRSRRLPRPAPWMAVGAVALVGVGVNASQLTRDPLWQDEIASLIAAQSIRRHGLPQLPSGLYYFKGELFHALLAVVATLSSDVAVLRSISLLWFAGTILVFGLMLMPMLAPGRPVLHVVATALMTLAPMESTWARDIRMYQQMQFFAMLFAVLIVRALTQGRRRQIVGSALALLAMYLSHEESFVLLPAVPVLALVGWRYRWWASRVWYQAYGAVGVVVALQYSLSKIHPVNFGEDLSNRPYVGWDPQQVFFYTEHVFFKPLSDGGSLIALSMLAVVAMVVGLARRDAPRLLISVLLVASVVSMSLLFTVKVERYAFIVVPLVIALGSLGGADLCDALRRLAGHPGSPRDRSRAPHIPRTRRPDLVAVAAIPGALALLLTLAATPGDYAVAAARLTGTTTTYRHADYRPAADYVARNWRSGDVFVTLCPPDLPAYYLGRRPDRIIATGRNKLLYLIERNGIATDTIYGSPVLLTGADVVAYVHSHPRVWLISDTGSSIAGVPPDVRAAVAQEFHLVMQGVGSTVYTSATT